MAAGSRPIRVLHVDDEPDFADMAARFLENDDPQFTVDTAESASEGLDRLRSQHYDCVVSDYDILGTNGVEFLESVRDIYPRLPFILFTGKGSEQVASEAITAGVTEYLQKQSGTSQYELLSNRIRNAVERVRSEEEAENVRVRLELLANHTQDILWMYTADWSELLFINDAYEDIWGRSIEELREYPPAFQRGVHPDDREITREAMDRLSDGEHIDIEFRVNADEGFGRWVWVQGYPVFEDGEVTRVTGFARDITHRKEREQRLRHEQARIQLALDVTSSYVFEIDFETGEERRFGDWAAIHDVASEAVPDTEAFISEAVHPDDRHLFRERYLGLDLEPGRFIEYEYRTNPRDGDYRWLRSRLQIMENPDGDGVIGVGLATDITDLKHGEQAIERLNERYETILANIHETVLVTDADGSFTYICPNVEFILGYGVDDIAELGSIDELLDEELVQRTTGSASEDITNVESTLTDRDGVEHTVLVSARSVSIEEGSCLYTIRDITDRKERERLFERILETSPVGIAVIERSGEISQANHRAEDILGLERSEIQSRTYDDPEWEIAYEDGSPIPPEEHPVNRVFETGERVVGFKHWVTLPDGSKRWLSSNSAPILNAEGRVEQVVVGLEDITDAKQRRDEVIRENHALDELTSIVSHDLRNPLQVAEGSIELAMEDCESTELERAAAALSRSQSLIDDLLVLAREGSELGEREEVELGSFLEECWRHVRTANAGLRIETDRTVRADRSRLRQVFENLFRNSVEHGGEDVTVLVGDVEGGIFIEDDGDGVAGEVRQRVFDPGVSTSETGTGIGLAIVEKIVTAHGWRIRVLEAADGGTRFEITGMR